MKNFNLTLFLGCCVISAGIITAGIIIADQLDDTPSDPSVIAAGVIASFVYLTKDEAAAFLRIAPDDLMELVRDRAMDNAFAIVQGNYVFSREQLIYWMEGQIASFPPAN